MKSHTFKKKLTDLLNSSLQRFGNGSSLYLKDASFKHMLVDPFTIVSYLAEGVLGLDKESLAANDRKGVRQDHVVTSKLVETEEGTEFELGTKKCYMFRFPYLHQLEGRLLNEDNVLFNDTESMNYYTEMARKGKLQGLAIYSLWDMNPEGQSGADFDGDQSGFTDNEEIVDSLSVQPLFLDYSRVNGALENGCPFVGEARDLNQFLSKEDVEFMESNNITLEKDKISAPAELSNTKEWIDLVGKLGAYLSRHTLEGNNIGRFTNISLSCQQIISELNYKLSEIKALNNEGLIPAIKALEEEIAGYEKLTLFLTTAIRWEVDKAKHGGAYFNMMPFIYTLINKTELAEVIEMEKRYSISLQRIIFGSKLK